MATVYRKGKARAVRDLGWFIRKARKTAITRISMIENPHGGSWVLEAEFEDGERFATDFMSRTPRESMSDLAFALRREIIAKHNPHGTIPAKDVLRLLKRLREAGVNFDPSWERVDA